MKLLLQKLSRWFHSFDEDCDPPMVVGKTPDSDGRVGMIGWY